MKICFYRRAYVIYQENPQLCFFIEFYFLLQVSKILSQASCPYTKMFGSH